MLNNLIHKWQSAIKVISEMLCETKRIAEQCSIGTSNDTSRLDSIYEKRVGEGIPVSLHLPISYYSKIGKEANEFATNKGIQEWVMRVMFRSVWETAYCINTLTETFINNPNLISMRNVLVMQRDLIDKVIDVPFIHRSGKSHQYFDFQADVSYPQKMLGCLPDSERHREDEWRTRMNQHIANFVRKYYPTWGDWMKLSPGEQEKKLHNQLKSWTKLKHKARLRDGLLLYIDEEFYNLDTMGLTTSSIKEQCERLPYVYHLHSLYVHDSIENPIHREQGWKESSEQCGLWATLGICAFALYVAAAHYYDCAEIRHEMEGLQRTIKENLIDDVPLFL